MGKLTSTTALALAAAYGALFGGALSVAHSLGNRSPILLDSVLFGVALAVVFCLASLAVHLAVTLVWRAFGRASRHTASTPLLWSLSAFNLLFFVPNIAHGRTLDESFFGAGLWGMAASAIVRAVMAGALAIALAVICHGLVRRYPLRKVAVATGIVGAALLVAHCTIPMAFAAIDRPAAPPLSRVLPARDPVRADQKVLFLGLDGADLRVIERMVAQGDLPHFERLMKGGTWGPLATLEGTTSPAIWASIWTGKTRREHRVLDFFPIRLPGMKGQGLFPMRRTYVVELASLMERLGWLRHRVVSRSSLAVPPIWEILDHLGVGVGVVDGYYFSIPAAPLREDDSYLFSRALRFLKGPSDSVDDLSPETLAALVQPVRQVAHFAPFEDEDDCFWQSKTLLSLLDAGTQPDYVQLYCHQPDLASHKYWKWHQPELFLGVSPDEISLYGDEIRRIHVELDVILGQILERLDDDTTLIVASDHGQSPVFLHHRHYAHHLHGPPGILLMVGPNIRADHRLMTAGIYDLMPTVLHLLGLPIPEDLDGRVLLDAFDTEFVRNAVVRTTASYDGLGSEFADDAVDLEIGDEELENLRALGYVN